jgi:hypothetical protein
MYTPDGAIVGVDEQSDQNTVIWAIWKAGRFLFWAKCDPNVIHVVCVALLVLYDLNARCRGAMSGERFGMVVIWSNK